MIKANQKLLSIIPLAYTRSALFLLLLSLTTGKLWAQAGCTDPKAQNYNSSATVNDGSCTYPTTSISLTNAKTLPSTLNEGSTLVLTDGNLWTLEDSGNPASIYRISETDGSILQTVSITNATNVDWEELTADANYIYIGDFGNNANGNRTNLKIYRVSKADIGNGATANVIADIINFSYQDQVIQNPVTNGPNNTKFDCEAFIIKDNTLHLFTKDWITGMTRHYTLPPAPGTYVAQPIEEFNVNGLITGANISTNNDIVLVGYSTNLIDLFMWVLYDYTGTNFFSGNKRRLDLGKSINFADRTQDKGQIEGVTFTNNGNGYVSSERINRTILGTTFTVPPRLYSFSIASLIALPVELLTFEASYRNQGVTLTWQTVSELNTAFFVIERSPDAANFKEIGKQYATGNSNRTKNYVFTDNEPLDGSNFYRLRQVDLDGASRLFGVRAVKIHAKEGKFHAYTGTSFNNLVIDFGYPLKSAMTYQVISINGSVLYRGTLQKQKQIINMANLARGQYVVRLSNGQSVKFQKK